MLKNTFCNNYVGLQQELDEGEWLFAQGQEQLVEELHLAVVCVQQGVWSGRGFVEAAAAAVESSASQPVAGAGTESDRAVTAESAEQPLSKKE